VEAAGRGADGAAVLLVSMPWTTLRAPSIQIGTVKAVLDRSGVPAATAHLYVPFYDQIAARVEPRFRSVDEFEQCGWLFGEWAFAVPPFRARSESADERFRMRFAREFGERAVDQAFAVRRLVPQFLEWCADQVLEAAPAVVGFSTTFAQTVPSLALAAVLKRRRPALRTVLGGSNCEGPMGEAAHRLFPWIDVVVRGEAETVAGPLFAELVEGSPVTPRPGLCIRDGDATHVVPEQRPRGRMDDVPLPDYADYFARVAGSGLADAQLWLPYETSRGCWWGVKHLCTFCAANGQTVTFRSRSAEVVLDHLADLPRRYGRSHVWFVDNILDERYLTGVFPQLADRQQGLTLFTETKAHLGRPDLECLRDAGVTIAQVGVESLSTRVLALMDKGTTVIQNVRILKWCAELGIRAFWNIIYGFPGESPDDYAAMARLVPALAHLDPPNLPVPLRLDRFSPYHTDPDRYGIEITGPLPVQSYVHTGHPADVLDLQYFFSFRYRDGRRPATYAAPLIRACERWRAGTRDDFGALYYRVDDGIVSIRERRAGFDRADHVLSPLESRIYLACDAGLGLARLHRELPPQDRDATTPEATRAVVERMVGRGWMMRDDRTYLSLAVAADRARSPRRRLALLDALADARVPAVPGVS
jgi:ribosomal peptide maturation radical SAM protein 1